MNFLELPDCMLMEIFEYLTYEEVSKNRLVSFPFFVETNSVNP